MTNYLIKFEKNLLLKISQEIHMPSCFHRVLSYAMVPELPIMLNSSLDINYNKIVLTVFFESIGRGNKKETDYIFLKIFQCTHSNFV